MNQWQRFLRWWLATPAPVRQSANEATQEAQAEEELSTSQAAGMLRHPDRGHPANRTNLQAAAQRLQRGLGNRGVQLLAEDRGEPLPAAVRNQLSGPLGADLADVQIHQGPAGAELARLAGADAVTVGRDIAFAEGQYAPDTPQGQQLLNHELAHTVQTGASETGDVTQLEHAATVGRPAAATAAAGQLLRQPKKSWSERVNEANAETNAATRRTLLVALVQEALGTGYQVNIVAATPASGAVASAQYQAAPAINFDFNLENKEYWPGAGRKGKLGPRTGYFFSDAGTGYAILGPGAIEASTPILTRMHADHELFHASHHMGAGKRDNDELEAWTDAFVNYFHQVHTARKSWAPLITYYEGAESGPRKKALDALVAYFNKQPVDIQKAMIAWLARRKGDMADKQLVIDLAAKLPATVAKPKP